MGQDTGRKIIATCCADDARDFGICSLKEDDKGYYIEHGSVKYRLKRIERQNAFFFPLEGGGSIDFKELEGH